MGGEKSGAAGRTRRAVGGWALAAIVVAVTASPAAALDARLGWTSVQNAAGYRVYVRQTGNSYTVGTNVGLLPKDASGIVYYIARGLPNGITNFFAITAYDASGRESARSNELSALLTATPAATATRSATAAPSRTATRPPTAIASTASTPTPRPSNTAVRTATRTANTAATPTRTPSPSAGAATIWGPTAVPANAADPEAVPVELGVKFTSDVNGLITGIRFYKGATNTGTHSGTLWRSNGQRLATATFSGETASGWQQVNFATPVAITANTVYVASYHTNVGHYAFNSNYFAAAGVDRPPLHALRNGVSGGNGVYVYGASAFPSSTYNSNNYWVDVVFSANQATSALAMAPAAPPTARTATSASAAARTALSASARTATATPSATPTATRVPIAGGHDRLGRAAAPANAADPEAVRRSWVSSSPSTRGAASAVFGSTGALRIPDA